MATLGGGYASVLRRDRLGSTETGYRTREPFPRVQNRVLDGLGLGRCFQERNSGARKSFQMDGRFLSLTDPSPSALLCKSKCVG